VCVHCFPCLWKTVPKPMITMIFSLSLSHIVFVIGLERCFTQACPKHVQGIQTISTRLHKSWEAAYSVTVTTKWPETFHSRSGFPSLVLPANGTNVALLWRVNIMVGLNLMIWSRAFHVWPISHGTTSISHAESGDLQQWPGAWRESALRFWWGLVFLQKKAQARSESLGSESLGVTWASD